MENSLKLQMDVKNNAEDLRRYMLDLQSWEEEMKQKETGLKSLVDKVSDIPPPRNKIKRNITVKDDEKKLPENEKKPKKIHAYDYSSWDKYDADKACDELDKEEPVKPEVSQSNTIENENEEEEEKEVEDQKSNMKSLDEAFYEKELGNQFVRREKWEDAIKCYTRAIELDSRNPIYYANRAICFIKLKNFRSAEVDATVAIQLDNTYVKAYQRRAFARLALGQIEEALTDYKEIVKLEPKNAYANAEIVKIEKRLKSGASNVKEVKKTFDPKTIFKTYSKKEGDSKSKESVVKDKKIDEKKEVERKAVEVTAAKETPTVKETKKVEELKVEKSLVKETNDDVFDKVPDGFTIVKSVHVPPHLRSKKPLRRITVKDVISDSETFDEYVSICNRISEDVKIKKKPEDTVVTINKVEAPDEQEIGSFPKPETFLQFQQAWKIVKKNPELAINYLKTTTPKTLYKILRHNLESDLFTELISVLSSVAKTDSEFVYSILCELTGVDRFGSLTLFFSQSDKENLSACIDSLKSARTEREIQDLREFYHCGSV